jgi:hypothetical protein
MGDKLPCGCHRSIQPREIEAIGLTLSSSMLQALADFRPGVWYGTATPTKRASAHKGHMVRMGLAEHNGASPASAYCLTELGERVRSWALVGSHP